jgi:hypothetical protein
MNCSVKNTVFEVRYLKYDTVLIVTWYSTLREEHELRVVWK